MKNTLFDNPMVESARASMTPEMIEEYKRAGEHMYDSVDFDKSAVLNNPEMPMLESIAYITEALKSGMDVSYLSDEEREVMKTQYGDDWERKLNFKS